MTAIHSF